MNGENKYEKAYKLDKENGLKTFLRDIPKLQELRFGSDGFDISDMLLDFDLAMKRCLTKRQYQVMQLAYIHDYQQENVAERLQLSQQTVQEHIDKSINSLVTYHMLEKRKLGEVE